MSRRWKVIGAIVCLIAIVSFASWPLWKKLLLKEASARLYEKTKAVVDKNPQLKPAWDKALEDGVLTTSEAKEILEKAGEKPDPE